MSITKTTIREAHERIRPYIHCTAIMKSQAINDIAGCDLYFKCENFQKIGAFKIRGGMNAVLSLPKEKLQEGVATHSSGNHAQAIAFAARAVGTKAYIVMPNTSPQVKVNAVKGYGAEIIFCEPNQQAREEALHKIVEKTGAVFIHPYNNEAVIAGQATAAKELLEEVSGLDYILVPVGGGGLLSGTALAAHYFSPAVKVYAGEPEGAADAVLSFKTGKIETAPYINTIADGLQTKLGDITLPIIRQYVADVLVVSDEEMIAAMRLIYERMKIIVEPSSIVPFAALLKNKELFAGKKTGIIFSGGNVDLKKLGEWFS